MPADNELPGGPVDVGKALRDWVVSTEERVDKLASAVASLEEQVLRGLPNMLSALKEFTQLAQARIAPPRKCSEELAADVAALAERVRYLETQMPPVFQPARPRRDAGIR